MSADRESRIGRRLIALREAIASRDWDDVQFHFANVVRGVGRLVADVEISRLPDEEAWVPLERATPVPIEGKRAEVLRARGGNPEMHAESEMWKNPIYSVVVSRHEDGWVMELSIRRNDRQPVHDWRHFQMIKTQLAGAEIEAIELYPAESRLMDTANQYYLYCLPPGHTMPMGYVGPRILIDADEQEGIGSVQRPLPQGWTSTFQDVYGRPAARH